MDDLYVSQKIMANHCDMVLKHSLGFGNESFGLLYDRVGARKANFPAAGPKGSAAPTASAIGAPAISRFIFPYDVDPTAVGNVISNPPPITVNSTYPWLEWDNRPYVSAGELLNVPAASQAQMMRQYSAIDPNLLNKPNPYGLSSLGQRLTQTFTTPKSNAIRSVVMQAPFGALANVFAASAEELIVTLGPSPPFPPITIYLPSVAGIVVDPVTTVPIPDANGNLQPYGAPNFSRILEYVQAPSRFVGTDTLLNAETFNDVPGVDDSVNTVGTAIGTNITDSNDPRFKFQPPFNKVARERDPGKVNLNTVTGRRLVDAMNTPRIWSEVYDGIMHRYKNPLTGAGDDNLRNSAGNTVQLGHFGPAWRDVVLSRRGYVQFDAAGTLVDKPAAGAAPDTFQSGLNNTFPTIFANPFRSPDAGDLVPVLQMMQYGVDASMERVHPRNRGAVFDATTGLPVDYDAKFGDPAAPVFGDARDAGFGNDGVSRRLNFGTIPIDALSQMPITAPVPPGLLPVTPTTVLNYRDLVPLFAEARDQSFADTNRNPYMMYEPMSRLGNLVTNRSGAYAVWITVGYFEVEPGTQANPQLADWGNQTVKDHFGGDIDLYNRAYPDGYMLGKELGSETGDVKRPRGFYIIDRTEEVGFKPGEDLNVEKTIRLRRRIE